MAALPFPMIDDIGAYYMLDDIYDFLGEGTFASVFKAVSTTTRETVRQNEVVALKMIAKRNLTNDKLVRDVVNEVHVLRRAAHPNCVRFIECLQTPLHVVIVTEHVEGVELFHALKQQKFTEGMVLDVMRQLLGALAYVHDVLHIVHRDVKPENILISTAETPMRVVLVDFGLARSCERRGPRLSRDLSSHFQRPRQMSSAGRSMDSLECDSPMLATPCGTLKYAAPETVQSISQSAQLSTTKQLLSRLDVYAAGVIMYVMLSGTLPFKNFSNKASLVMEMRNALTFEGPRWASVNPEVVQFIRALLVFDPALRPSAAEALQYPLFKIYSTTETPLSPTAVASPISGNPLDSTIRDRGAMKHAFEAMRAPESALYYNEEEASEATGATQGHSGVRTPNSRCLNIPFGGNNTGFSGSALAPASTGTRPPQSNYFDFL